MTGNSLQSSSRKASDSRLLAALDAVHRDIQSNKSGNINKSIVVDLVSQLESKDHSVCSRLDSKIYCTAIQALLQCHTCREGERGIYLLGAALYHDTLSPSKERSVKRKKEAIGKECLALLLDFFIDGSKSGGMRQWVGILTLQLFQCCDSNVQKFELGPEQQRRELGNVVLKEPNEILRIICGQLITSLLTSGVVSEHLWPVNVDKRLYAHFPEATLGSRGWNQQFQNYMDNVFEIMEPTDSLGQLYFTQNVSLTPSHNFGPEDHNVMIVIEPAKMIIWAGVVVDTQNFNHCLEVPLGMINRMLIKTRSDSQLRGVLNVYLFLDETGQACHLDCVDTALSQICMVLQQSVVESMRDDLREVCPHLEVIDDDGDKPDVVSDQDVQQKSQHTSQSVEVLQFSSKGISVVRHHLVSSPENGPSKGESGMANDNKIAEHAINEQTTLEIGGDITLREEHTKLNGLPIDIALGSSPEIEKGNRTTQSNVPKTQTTTERKRGHVPKPKAKPPLRQAHKSGANSRQETHPSETSLILDKEPPSKGLSCEAVQLAAQFPSTDVSTRRGMVLASNGNYEVAVKALGKKLTDKTSNPKGPNHESKINGDVKSSSKNFEGNKISQLHLTQGNNGRRRRSTTTAAESENQQLMIDPLAVTGTEPRKYSLKRTLVDLKNGDDGCYDIPPEETCQEQFTTGENNSIVNSKSAQSNTTIKIPIAKKATIKDTRSTKAGQKKRQSAPTAMKPVNSRGTGQRQAATVARKKFIEASSSDEHQTNEGLETQISRPVEKSSKVANKSSTEYAKGRLVNPSTPGKDHLLMQQQDDIQEHPGSLALAENNFDLYGASPIKPSANTMAKCITPKEPFDDLFDATPEKPTKGVVHSEAVVRNEPSDHALPKRKYQTLGQMAAKMNSLLGDLDEPDGSEDITKQMEEKGKHGLRKLSLVGSEKLLVNDYLCGKTPVVGFNDKGARNQGQPGLLTGSKGRSGIDELEYSMPTKADQPEGRKRRREKPGGRENNSPPRKRQSLSPNPKYTPVQGNNDEYFRSSPPYQIETGRKSSGIGKSSSPPQLQRISKPSSQGSRVDKNGSPLATRSPEIDRIGYVKRKLLCDHDSEEAHTPESGYQRILFTAMSPEIFGPKVRLGSIPKARPSSSLEDTASRYIPHKKTRNGHYQGIDNNEIIAPANALLDPFIDKAAARPTNGFSDRLMAGSSSAVVGSKRLRKDMDYHGLDHAGIKAKALPAISNTNNGAKSTTYGRVSKRLTEVFLDDEDTLVDPRNRSPSDKYALPEMTSDTTCESRSPLADKSRAWNAAVRPHYTNLSETIHQVADEVIIRLADEEDAIKLIANQYKENGEKLLYQTAQKRIEEKASMTRELDQKKVEMVALFTDAKGLADRTRQTVKKSPLSAVDKQWRSRCEGLQAQIDQGKMTSGRGMTE